MAEAETPKTTTPEAPKASDSTPPAQGPQPLEQEVTSDKPKASIKVDDKSTGKKYVIVTNEGKSLARYTTEEEAKSNLARFNV